MRGAVVMVKAPGWQWEIGQVCVIMVMQGMVGVVPTAPALRCCPAPISPHAGGTVPLRIADSPHTASSITGRNVNGATAVENNLVVPQ